MAIQRGPYGSFFIKRLGNTVGYKKGNGEYGINAYQPNVANPRTYAQQVQRAKFSFLRTLSAGFAGDALRGLENQPYTGLPQAFMSMNMDGVELVPGLDYVKIDFMLSCANMKLSQGYLSAPVMVNKECVGGTLKLELGCYSGSDGVRPDGVIVVVGVGQMLGLPGYRFQVYDWGFEHEHGDMWLTDEQTVNMIYPDGDAVRDGYTVLIWMYNYRYVGGKVGHVVETIGVRRDHEDRFITYASEGSLIGYRKQYSATVFDTQENTPS